MTRLPDAAVRMTLFRTLLASMLFAGASIPSRAEDAAPPPPAEDTAIPRNRFAILTEAFKSTSREGRAYGSRTTADARLEIYWGLGVDGVFRESVIRGPDRHDNQEVHTQAEAELGVSWRHEHFLIQIHALYNNNTDVIHEFLDTNKRGLGGSAMASFPVAGPLEAEVDARALHMTGVGTSTRVGARGIYYLSDVDFVIGGAYFTHDPWRDCDEFGVQASFRHAIFGDFGARVGGAIGFENFDPHRDYTDRIAWSATVSLEFKPRKDMMFYLRYEHLDATVDRETIELCFNFRW
ncbi:MAG: hypothetical protein K8T20_10030 [Planctomycetes bacterium]|nr:hypothetical protein [Planctomycetota bacterium]